MEVDAKDLKVGDIIKILGATYTIKNLELSNIGKHGSAKVRLELFDKNGEDLVEIFLQDDKIEKVS